MTKVYDVQLLRHLFNESLELSLRPCPSTKLFNAIRYTLLGEGKRLRPLMVLASARAAHADNKPLCALKKAMPAALAVEYVHSYSLIHDDLPAMDDDDYRRGRLSVHRRFDEALAILAGDALLADAFFILANAPHHAALQCRELAHACGRSGLVSGQALDLAAERSSSKDAWLLIHEHKTARLFKSCATLGALSQGCSKNVAQEFGEMGHNFGMAFQIKDDIDDQAGIFLKLGLEASKALLESHVQKAHDFAISTHPSPLLEIIRTTFAL